MLIGGAMGAVGGVATIPSRGYHRYGYNDPGYYGAATMDPVTDLPTTDPVTELLGIVS